MTGQTKGAGPSADKAPADLWTLLTELPRPHTEVPFPRKHPVTGEPLTEKVAIWVLTEAELMSARAAADAYAKEMLSNPQKSGDANLGYQEIFRNECIVEVICRACRNVKDLKAPAFPNPMLARKFLTSDEFSVLFQAYCDFQAECGPILSHMTREEMNAWIDRLMEGASLVPLAALSSGARNQLLLHSVSLLQQSRTGSGSPGAPQAESSTSTSPQTGQESSPSSKRESLSAGALVSPDEKPPKPLMDE